METPVGAVAGAADNSYKLRKIWHLASLSGIIPERLFHVAQDHSLL